MTQAFPVSGNIEPATFPHLIVDLHGHGATGSLKVTGSHHPKALYFRSGRILFGSSNDPRDQLGSILIESGRITREQLDEVNGKVGPGNPLAKVLSESGFVNQRELGDAARVKVERILADVLSWDSGTFEFEDGVLPKGAVDLKLSTERLLLSAVQRIPDRAFALRHVELRSILAPVPESESALSEIRAEVWPLLERLDGRRTLKDAIALTRLDEFEAAKTACALLFLGVVRKAEEAPAGEELDLAREAKSGLGADDDEAEAPLFAAPAELAAAEVAVEPAQEEDAPFVFPEPAPPPAPELSFGVEPEREPAPDVEVPAPQQALPIAPRVEAAPPLAVPSYPAPSFPSPVVAPAPPVAPTPAGAPAPAAPMLTFSTPEPAATHENPSSPTATPAPPSFSVEPPSRISFDTVPGDRPAYTPSATGRSLPLIPPPPRKDAPAASPRPSASDGDAPEIAVAPSASRPNLKALDELLSPAGSGRRPSAERRSEGWQPQFRPSTASRRAAVRAPQGSSSRVPLIISALLMVVVGTVAAWYFLLRTPATPPTAAPVTMAQARPTVPPRTTPPAPPTTAPAAAAASPSAAGTSTPATTLAPPVRPAPTRSTPSPRATPVPVPATSSGASARVLLGRGALAEASREFVSSLRAGSRTRFSVQMLTACAPETVQKAVSAAGSEELFILPVVLNGRACYRLCWGVYADRQRAEAALASIPAYFRQGGARPRVSPLAELLP